MQFKVKDVVVHPAYGIGHIVKIQKKQFSNNNTARMYYQITMPNHNTIWIPVEKHVSNGLRLVTVNTDLDQYRTLLKSRPILLKNDHRLQHLELISRLKQGTFEVTCEVVRDLTVSGRQKPLNMTNKSILKRTKARLYQEWAMAADVSIAEATREVNTLLHPTQEVVLN